ncbi:MAG: non-heme iron oxygenase ferredoxin subunit, partial [Candidatus Kerfeldbacteria bacterium]|nr:non-heme iron oxygenase ferredoxin subunit [Candidatus Kerfeldbacteria bacterium]
MTKALLLHKLPVGTMKRVVVDGRALCLYHLSDGVYATDDRCTHAQASLSMGEMIDDACVECPLHGSRFNIRTGKALALPAYEPVA